VCCIAIWLIGVYVIVLGELNDLPTRDEDAACPSWTFVSKPPSDEDLLAYQSLV
jgi:hypothetical protein